MTVNSGNGILTIIVDGVNCKFWKLIDWFTKNNFKLKEFKFNQKKTKNKSKACSLFCLWEICSQWRTFIWPEIIHLEKKSHTHIFVGSQIVAQTQKNWRISPIQ